MHICYDHRDPYGKVLGHAHDVGRVAQPQHGVLPPGAIVSFPLIPGGPASGVPGSSLILYRGTKLKIVCTIVKISETMAHTVCDVGPVQPPSLMLLTAGVKIHDFNTGKLYCRGTHMKAWKGPQAKL